MKTLTTFSDKPKDVSSSSEDSEEELCNLRGMLQLIRRTMKRTKKEGSERGGEGGGGEGRRRRDEEMDRWVDRE